MRLRAGHIRIAVAAPLAVVAAVALASCGGSGTGSSSAGGVLHIGTTYPIDSMNPFVAQSDYSYAVYEYIYPQLVQYNSTLGIAPDFARSWSTSADGRTWTFHTVPHAHWSDGKPLTAADVAWTINEVMKYKNGPAGQWAGLLEHMIGASAPNPTTLVIRYSTPPTAVTALKKAGFVVTTTPSISMKTFIINTNPRKTTHRELLDPRVREAIEYATDRSQIIKTAWLGLAQPGSTIIAPADGSWHDANVKVLPFDLAKANHLLDAAGAKMGPNGVRIAGGHPMSYKVIFPPDERGTGDRTFQIMQSDLQKVGISITQQNMDDRSTINAMSAPNSKYQTFDMAMWDWVPPVDPDFMLSVLTCAQLGNNSDSGYCNPAYDRMYARQSTLISTSARRALIWQMQPYI